jgi:hypothetical protein
VGITIQYSEEKRHRIRGQEASSRRVWSPSDHLRRHRSSPDYPSNICSSLFLASDRLGAKRGSLGFIRQTLTIPPWNSHVAAAYCHQIAPVLQVFHESKVQHLPRLNMPPVGLYYSPALRRRLSSFRSVAMRVHNGSRVASIRNGDYDSSHQFEVSDVGTGSIGFASQADR